MEVRRSLSVALALSALSFAAGCSSTSRESATSSVVRAVSISPNRMAIANGQLAILQLSISEGDDALWYVNGILDGNSSVVTIAAHGLTVTHAAPAGNQGLVATITGTIESNPPVSASATICVVPPGTRTPGASCERPPRAPSDRSSRSRNFSRPLPRCV